MIWNRLRGLYQGAIERLARREGAPAGRNDARGPRRSLGAETWSNRLVLATRKLEFVENALTRDLEALRAKAGSLPADAATGFHVPTLEQKLSEIQNRLTRQEGLLERAATRLSADAGAPAASGQEVDAGGAERGGSPQEVEALRKRLEDVEKTRAYLDAQHCERLAEVRSKARKKVATLEKRIRELEEGMVDLPRPAEKAEGEVDARVQKLEQRIAELERTRMELEGRHVEELTVLADRTRTRVEEAEAVAQDKTREVEELGEQVRSLEARIEELLDLTEEMPVGRIGDLMADVEPGVPEAAAPEPDTAGSQL